MKMINVVTTILIFLGMYSNANCINEYVLQNEYGLFVYDYIDNGDLLNLESFLNGKPSNQSDPINEDYLYSTIDIPKELNGCLPKDICFNSFENKFYVFGGKTVLVVNGSNYEILNSINVSNTGSIDDHFVTRPFPVDKRLAYNSINNKLYCATDDKKMVIIDCNNDEIILEYTVSEIINFGSTSVIYNAQTNKVFWVLNPHPLSAETIHKLKTIDGESNNILNDSTWPTQINSIDTNSTGDKIIIDLFGSETSSSSIKILNSANLSIVSDINTGTSIPGELRYNPNSNKIYCDLFNENRLMVIDEISGQILANIELPFTRVLNMIYSLNENKIYCTGYSSPDHSDHFISVIDGTLDQVIVSYPLNISRSLIYNSIDNNIFCGGKDTIIMIDEITNNILGTTTLNGNSNYRLSYNNLENTVFSANKLQGTISIINSSCILEESLQIGGATKSGCYNSTNNKIYWMDYCSANQNSFVSIMDGESNQIIDVLNLGSDLRSIKYNEENNVIYVLSNDNNSIFVIDGESNNIVTTIQTSNSPYYLYLSPINKLYCGCSQFVDIINTETNQVISSIYSQGISSEFTYNSEYDKIYTSMYSNDKVLVIDGTNNNILANIQVGDNPIAITNNPNDNEIYVANKNSYNVQVIDGITNNIINSINVQNRPVDLIYNELNNKLYILQKHLLTVFDIVLNQVINEIDIGYLNQKMFLNPQNNRIYIHTLFDDNLEMAIYVIDCNNDELSSVVSLEQFQLPGTIFYRAQGSNLVYNTSSNQVLCGNRGFSNISVLQCGNEEKILSHGWNWESFPRLERDETVNEAVDVVPILGTIEPFDMDYIEFFKELEYLYYEDEVWNPLFYNIQSTLLYKIAVVPNEDRTLELYGTRMPEDFVIEDPLEAGEYQWLGFWLPGTQNMIESFGEYWQYVAKVKSEEWFYSPAIVQRGGDPTYPTVLSAENLTLSYGKGYMVLFKENTPSITDFHWTLSAAAEEPEKKAEPENFTYIEKADYEAIDVFNIPLSVTEIGVFEDDVCVGAVVVEDTCAQILVYSENANRDPIPFTLEVLTGRGFSTPIKDYQVLNLQIGKYETKSIFSGRQEYSIIRFSDEDEPENEILSTLQLYGNYPNPFNPTTTISFSLPNEENIELTIYNIKGQKVKTLYSGLADEGEHTMIWEGKDSNDKLVSSGLYFYKLKTNNKELTRKMLMMK